MSSGRVVVNWNPNGLLRRVDHGVGRNLDRASIHLTNAIKTSFGSMEFTDTESGKRIQGKEAKKLRKKHGRSTAGNPPNIQTGKMKRSIIWERAAAKRRKIGSTIRGKGDVPSYPLLLELGTKHIDPRPWLVPNMRKSKAAMGALLKGKV